MILKSFLSDLRCLVVYFSLFNNVIRIFPHRNEIFDIFFHLILFLECCLLQCTMVLRLDGNSELDAHVRSKFWYLICLRHSIRTKAVTNRIFFSLQKRHIIFHVCATCLELPSNISTMQWAEKNRNPNSFLLLQLQLTRVTIDFFSSVNATK